MKLKRTLAAIIAATTMAVGGLSTSAATVWDITTSGIKTTYTGTSNQSIEYDSLYYNTSKIRATFVHTTGDDSVTYWRVTGTNMTSSTKYMGASTLLYDETTKKYITSASNFASGDKLPGSQCSSESSYGGVFPTTYNLEYSTYIAGGNSQYAGIVEEIEFYECF